MTFKDTDYLKESYSKRKGIIKERLKYFKSVWNEDDKRIFAELCFCLLTPQSKAKICVRFNNNKSRYIIQARNMFKNISIKNKLNEFKNYSDIRNWLVENVNGIGLKEAGHFMRNIGMYENVVILDRHILKNLHKHGVINEIPNPLSKRQYLDIEEKMKDFANKINIPIEEMDLLFWSEETGEVFK